MGRVMGSLSGILVVEPTHHPHGRTQGGPNSVEVRWDFEFIREGMKINKIRPKICFFFFFFTKKEIKMTQHVKSRFSLSFFFSLNHINL